MENQRETFNDHPIYSLSEIGASLRSVIAKNYPRAYYIKAEIIKLNFYPRSGHCYPELVEKEGTQTKAQMRAIIWAAQYQAINERFRRITGEPLKEGIGILCLATVEFDMKHGLSLFIQDIEPTYTLGEMAKNKLMVIEKLKKEGIFNANKEKKLPLLPQRIAVISVETSKGYSDFMVTLNNNVYGYRFYCQLFPSILQGDKAIITIPAQLIEIKNASAPFDCVVIIRGGGGDVGLSCYDDYRLVSAVANFPLPIIAGIGHSTNETITDMVAFESKITPTDVANFFIERYHNFDKIIEENKSYIFSKASVIIKEEKNKVAQLEYFRNNIAAQFLTREKNIINQIESKYASLALQITAKERAGITQLENLLLFETKTRINLEKTSISNALNNLKFNFTKIIDPQVKKIENNKQLLHLFSKQLLNKQNVEINNADAKLGLLHPDNILRRGFSITYLNQKSITDSNDVKPKDEIVTKLYKGEIKSVVT